MKKLALALVCLVSVAFFASCDPKVENPEPTISIYVGEDYVVNNQDIYVDDWYDFGFTMTSNAETGKELKSFELYIDGDKEFDTLFGTGTTSFTYLDIIGYSLSKEVVGKAEIQGKVTDVAGETATATITLNINTPDVLTVTPFEWRRDGGAAGTGLAEFGLEWKTNTSTNAVITPMDGATMFELPDPAVWDNINTPTDKAALFSETHVAQSSFNKISVTAADQDYDIVLGTVYNGENHLIHITHSTANQRSWHFTITGYAK